MKKLLLIVCLFLAYSGFGQEQVQTFYSKSTEVKGSEYIIAESNGIGKYGIHGSKLEFINTATGVIKEVKLPVDLTIKSIESIQVPELAISKILIIAFSSRTKQKGISDVILILSDDGSQMNEIDIQDLVVGNYILNTKTGRVTFFLNASIGNTKTDRANSQILIYDLKTLKKI